MIIPLVKTVYGEGALRRFLGIEDVECVYGWWVGEKLEDIVAIDLTVRATMPMQGGTEFRWLCTLHFL